MKKAGIFIGGLGLHGGAAAIVFYLFNMAIWSTLTAMLGGGLAMIGLGLIMWALYPVRRAAMPATAREDAGTSGPAPETARAQAA